MTKEKENWKKTLDESDALIGQGRDCLKRMVGKFLSGGASFITPTDGEGSEKKMSRIIS